MTLDINLQPWLLIPTVITAIIIWAALNEDSGDELGPLWLVLWICTAGISLATGFWAQWSAAA